MTIPLLTTQEVEESKRTTFRNFGLALFFETSAQIDAEDPTEAVESSVADPAETADASATEESATDESETQPAGSNVALSSCASSISAGSIMLMLVAAGAMLKKKRED